MKIKVVKSGQVQFISPEGAAEGTLHHPSNLPEPIIEIDVSELKGRDSLNIGRVVVVNDEGLSARFNLTVRLNEQNQAVMQLVAYAQERDDGLIDGKKTVREARASWRL